MNTKRLATTILVRSLLLTMTTLGAVHAFGTTQPQDKSAIFSVYTQQSAVDVKGTWSGTFFSKHSNVRSFTLTVVINADSRGHLVGSSSLNSDCLKGAHLQVSVTGTKMVLAGGNEEGDNLTIRGEIENGTLLKAEYVLNGSATGSCETDDGTGSLAKRQ